MSIQERMAELTNAEGAQKRTRGQDKSAPQSAETDFRIQEQILEQRKLFTKLEEVGIIDMLEEMTSPEKIKKIRTKSEEENNVGFHLAIPTHKDKQQDPEWYGEVLKPAVMKDGSVSGALVVKLSSFRIFHSPGHSSKREVQVSYTPNDVFTVKGQFVTYSDIVNEDSIGIEQLDEIELGFAKAFSKPFTEAPVITNKSIPTFIAGDGQAS